MARGSVLVFGNLGGPAGGLASDFPNLVVRFAEHLTVLSACDPRSIVESAYQWREDMQVKVRQAVADIEADVAAIDGSYPHNKGKLNLTELSRRADVGRVTLSGGHHRNSMAEIKALVGPQTLKLRPNQKAWMV